MGLAGVWGLSPRNEVLVRDGTFQLAGEAEGSGWTKVEGMMKSIWSGDGVVWAVCEDGGLWYRPHITQATPMGTNWFRLEVRPASLEVSWRTVMVVEDTLWALDTTDRLHTRTNVTADNIQGGTNYPDFITIIDLLLTNVRGKKCSSVAPVCQLQTVRPPQQASKLCGSQRGLGGL